MIDIYLRHPDEAPSNAGQLLSKFLFKWTQISAWRQSGNPFSTIFISIPFVYVQACWNQMEMINSKNLISEYIIVIWYHIYEEWNQPENILPAFVLRDSVFDRIYWILGHVASLNDILQYPSKAFVLSR